MAHLGRNISSVSFFVATVAIGSLASLARGDDSGSTSSALLPSWSEMIKQVPAGEHKRVLEEWTSNGVYPNIRDPETILASLRSEEAIDFYLDKFEEPFSDTVLDALARVSANRELDRRVRCRACVLLIRYGREDEETLREMLKAGEADVFCALAMNELGAKYSLLESASSRSLERDELLSLTIRPNDKVIAFLKVLYENSGRSVVAAQALSLVANLPDNEWGAAERSLKPMGRLLFASAIARNGSTDSLRRLEAAENLGNGGPYWPVRALEAYAFSGRREFRGRAIKWLEMALADGEPLDGGLPRSELAFYSVRALLLLGADDDRLLFRIQGMDHESEESLMGLAFRVNALVKTDREVRQRTESIISRLKSIAKLHDVPPRLLPLRSRSISLGVEDLAIIRANDRKPATEGIGQ